MALPFLLQDTNILISFAQLRYFTLPCIALFIGYLQPHGTSPEKPRTGISIWMISCLLMTTQTFTC